MCQARFRLAAVTTIGLPGNVLGMLIRHYAGLALAPLTISTSAGKFIAAPVEYSLREESTSCFTLDFCSSESVSNFSLSFSDISRRSFQESYTETGASILNCSRR